LADTKFQLLTIIFSEHFLPVEMFLEGKWALIPRFARSETVHTGHSMYWPIQHNVEGGAPPPQLTLQVLHGISIFQEFK
jgi:hypothetical protein